MKKSTSRIEALEARIAPAFTGLVDLGLLSVKTGIQVNGAANADDAGVSVTGVGDVNGDGYRDFVVGADQNDTPSANNGAAFLIYGKAAGFSLPVNLATLAVTDGYKIIGAAAGDMAGFSVHAAGDVNKDGFADYIIGADSASMNGAASGSAYVIFGSNTQPPNIQLGSLNGINGFELRGEAANDHAGRAVSGAGDVNGDGFADVIIGAPNNNAGAGAAYVVFGHTGSFQAVTNLSSLNGFNGFKITGFGNLSAGSSVAGPGDVNGDGFADVLVGAPGADGSAGAAFLIPGHGTPFASNPSLLVPNGTTVVKYAGVAAGNAAGFSVGAAGDVNGDGFADFIVGAPFAGATSQGSAYVVLGKSGALGALNQLGGTIAGVGFELDGDVASDQAGFSVSGAGDLNHDGYADVIVGAPFHDVLGLSNVGAAYVVLGSKTGPAANIALGTLNGTTGFIAVSDAASDNTGRSVDGAGDVNGDGFDDIIIGSPHGGVTVPGSAFVVYGGNEGATVKIATNGKSATFTDVDGDLVTIKTSKGPLLASEFTLTAANALGGSTLLKVNFQGQAALEGTDLSIMAKPQKIGGVTRGDGLVNLGNLEATGMHLGKVAIGGDLGQFHFGVADATPAAKTFAAKSIGLAGTTTQGGAGVGLSSLITGSVPLFVITTSVHDAFIAGGSFGTVKIGGSFVNSKFDVLGVTPAPTTQVGSVALKAFLVLGDFDRSQLLGGFVLGVNPDISFGSLVIYGNFIASDISVGVAAGADAVFGTADDAVQLAGGNPAITSTIAAITVKGQTFGTFAPGGQFGVTAQKISAATFNGVKLVLQKTALDHFIPIGGTGDVTLNEVA